MNQFRKKLAMFKRWKKILCGESVLASSQGKGKIFSVSEVKGYYNDLTTKVNDKTLLDDEGIPVNVIATGEKVYAWVNIAQYALGCYDLYLLNKDKKMLDKFLFLAERIYKAQEENGKWDCRSAIGSSMYTSSCMGQGQGCSVLLRAYIETQKKEYLDAAKKAIDFMLVSISDGGTALIENDELFFEKYPPQDGKRSSVLNGWAFALFGLFDYYIYTGDKHVKSCFEKSAATLANHIKEYDRGYWSDYDVIGTIASPAYHELHIGLFQALAEITGNQVFSKYSELFEKYQNSKFCKLRAVSLKFFQKMTEHTDAVLVQ